MEKPPTPTPEAVICNEKCFFFGTGLTCGDCDPAVAPGAVVDREITTNPVVDHETPETLHNGPEAVIQAAMQRWASSVKTAVDEVCASLQSDVMFPNVDGRCNCALYPPGALAPCADHPAQGGAATFQARVQPWLMACFGEEIAGDRDERNHRFLEESLELVQAAGCSASEAHQLVDYVYNRPVGEKAQEVGGVMVTLAALCLAQGLDMHAAAEDELARIWTMVEKIRAKQAAKPKHSPLPEAAK